LIVATLPRSVRHRGLAAAIVALAALTRPPIAAAGWTAELSLGGLDYPGLSIQGLQLAVAGGGGELRIARLRLAEREWHDLRLSCARLQLGAEGLACTAGRLRAPAPLDGARIDFAVAPTGSTGSLTLTLADGGSVRAELAPAGTLAVRIRDLNAALLTAVLPPLAAWKPAGALDCDLRLATGAGAPAVTAHCELRAGGFASADGLRAGEQLDLAFDISAASGAAGWRWRLAGEWSNGAIYLHPVYLPAGARLAAAGDLPGGHLRVAAAELAVDGIGSVRGNGLLGLEPPAVQRLEAAARDLDLEVLGRRVLAPLALPAQAGELDFSGRADAWLRLAVGRPAAFGARLAGAGVRHRALNMGLGPATGTLDWPGDGTGALALQLEGAHWRGLAFGAFPLRASLSGERVAIEPLAIPLLDGALRLSGLALWREGAAWQGAGQAAIDPISLPELSAAAGLPVLGGALAARFPRVRIGPGEIAVDGGIDIEVFDGRVRVSGLRLIEPFGVGAYARAELGAERLDLGLLTDSFDFGSIQGRVDVRVRDLELAGWRPVRFAARIESSPGRYRRRISQRAVQNLGALGGPGVVNAIQRSALRFFDSFGYRRLGWSCVLESGVCEMAGVDPQARREDGGFVIVEGRGVPALDVVGYNRRVDWDVLLRRLHRVTGAGGPVVVE
jgi:hypothetical protein